MKFVITPSKRRDLIGYEKETIHGSVKDIEVYIVHVKTMEDLREIERKENAGLVVSFYMADSYPPELEIDGLIEIYDAPME